ncbi:hypothetical protein ACFLZQ_07530 [Thermodesulfobacteriota bacterium]
MEREQLPRSTLTALPVSGLEHISTIIQRTVNILNTRENLRGRLEEIQRVAASVPDHDADVAQIHYALTRLSNWTIRTISFVSTIEMEAEVQDGKLF